MMVTFLFAWAAFAAGENPAEISCREAAVASALKLEAKAAAVKKVSTGEVRFLGGGARLFLFSVFVDSAKTAEHTHWEIVGELASGGKCRTVLSRRLQAP
jgi:hypothetical protein